MEKGIIEVELDDESIRELKYLLNLHLRYGPPETCRNGAELTSWLLKYVAECFRDVQRAPGPDRCCHGQDQLADMGLVSGDIIDHLNRMRQLREEGRAIATP